MISVSFCVKVPKAWKQLKNHGMWGIRTPCCHHREALGALHHQPQSSTSLSCFNFEWNSVSSSLIYASISVFECNSLFSSLKYVSLPVPWLKLQWLGWILPSRQRHGMAMFRDWSLTEFYFSQQRHICNHLRVTGKKIYSRCASWALIENQKTW